MPYTVWYIIYHVISTGNRLSTIYSLGGVFWPLGEAFTPRPWPASRLGIAQLKWTRS